MSLCKLRAGRVVAFAAVLVAGASAPSVTMAGVTFNDWNYAIDSQTDGSGAGNGFEMRGLAFREVNGMAYFAISGKAPLGGVAWGGALNNNISYGDLFLNFSSHNLDTAAEFNDPLVLGIRFAGSNDSLNNVNGSNQTLGLFDHLAPVSLMLQNSGYSTLQQYYNSGFGAASGAMGDLSTTTSVINYLGNGAMLPNIGSGTKIGDIALMDRSALSSLGLDFAHFSADPNGNNVFGFALSASLLPSGSFTAHLFYECINDGMALFAQTSPDITTNSTPAPEPATLTIWLTGMGLFLGYRVRTGRRSSHSV